MSAIIYCLTNTINGKCYVGLTTQGLERRWKEHCYDTKRTNVYLHNAIRKYGPSVFKKEILEETTVELMNGREIYWISVLVPEYNMTNGGEGAVGWKHSEETKQKIAIKNGGKNSAWLGKKHTTETKAKISQSLSGNKNPQYGKHLSPEVKSKLSAAFSGEKHPMYGKRGNKSPLYGRHHSEETKLKMRYSALLRCKMKKIFAPEITIEQT